MLWIHETKLIMYKMFHLHFPKRVDIYALVCMGELTLGIDNILMLEKCKHMNFKVFHNSHCIYESSAQSARYLSSKDNPFQIISFN